MVAALGHDFGKIVAGDGHAQIGADLAKQVFPDLTDAQYKAIAEHMGNPKTSLGKATKAADIDNGRSVGLKYSRDPVYIEGRTIEYP
jgi:metal-dependent HD superfamily phosphatase/phosphodiesterase